MKRHHSSDTIASILDSASKGRSLTDEDCLSLLDLADTELVEALFKTARDLRNRYFGNRVFLYGFVYTSTFCRNDCRFCFYRRSNKVALRYRKTSDEIVEASLKLADSGVHLIDLTTGEDPRNFADNQCGFDEFLALISKVKKYTGLPIMVSPGVVPDAILAELASAGADWYACYQETHNQVLFKKVRVGQNFGERFEKKRLAHRLGMLIEEGILCGIGESNRDVADSIRAMRFLGADQTRVMNFVPQRGTPMEDWVSPDHLRERVITAVMRLAFPDRLIPASLDVEGLEGLLPWLDAGANVVTSLIPPEKGLAGVAQNSLDIEDGRRMAASVREVLQKRGLEAASLEEYVAWINARKRALRQDGEGKVAAC
ncbi:MAG: methylornithine synthase PylB [Deltaproteobacteria bacterium]|nr:methylornithine synthase PylB [Deltaproteobacteria bacterium]MBW2082265.1 methylornithine synthase PylB [Deltaproteobacteria bacterium]